MTFNTAMLIAKGHYTADPFNQAKLREFYNAVKCVMKSAETGKGLYLAKKRHIPTICDYALNVADVTGVVKVIYDAVSKKFGAIVKN